MMLVIKGHKIQLDVTSELETALIAWCGTARWAYNFGLARKKQAYTDTGEAPSTFDLMKEVVVLKKTDEYAWLRDVAATVPRMALAHLEFAYKQFFRRVKEGKEKVGYPRFKSKKRSKMAVHFEAASVCADGVKVRIPKLGWLKMHQALRFPGRLVGSVCISLRAGKWYVSFTIETEVSDPIENQEWARAIGIDVGLKHLAVLSDGKKFDNPRVFYRLEKLLARAQRQMTRKKKGSNRWRKAKLRVQRIHKRIADLRANATHQVTAYIAANYGGVAIEDLNVHGMAQNRCLAKAIFDANFTELHLTFAQCKL